MARGKTGAAFIIREAETAYGAVLDAKTAHINSLNTVLWGENSCDSSGCDGPTC